MLTSSISWKSHFTFCLYEFDYSRFLIQVGVIGHLSFCVWIISHSLMFLRHVFEFHFFLFILKAEQESIVCIQNILFIHSPVNGYLGFSHLLTVVWLMILWSWFYRYLLKYLFLILLGIFPAIKLVEHVIIMVLNFLRSCYTIFHSGYNFFTLKEHIFWWTVNFFCNSHAY